MHIINSPPDPDRVHPGRDDVRSGYLGPVSVRGRFLDPFALSDLAVVPWSGCDSNGVYSEGYAVYFWFCEPLRIMNIVSLASQPGAWKGTVGSD